MMGRYVRVCTECYADESLATPLLNPRDCLENHTQYVCGTCGIYEMESEGGRLSYKIFAGTQVRRLSPDEVERYLSERS